jgi:hypothetical protein
MPPQRGQACSTRWIKFRSDRALIAWLLPVSAFSSWSRRMLATAWHRTLRLPMSATQSAPNGGLHSSWRVCRCSSRQGTRLPSSDGFLQAHLHAHTAPTGSSADHRKDAPSTHMRCMMTASLRATAIFAFFKPLRLASPRPQALSADHFSTRVSNVLQTNRYGQGCLRISRSPVVIDFT